MDVASLKRTINAKMSNDKVKQRIKKEIQNYKDQHQEFGVKQEEMFKPITNIQGETKSLIDEKQDKIIKQLQGNQRRNDEKQDKIIKELQGNQTAIMEALFEDAEDGQPDEQPEEQKAREQKAIEQKAIEQARKEENGKDSHVEC